MTFGRKFAIAVLTSASEVSISRVNMSGLLVTMVSNPSGYLFNRSSIILSRSLKAVDLSQNPNANFWHRGSTSLCRVLGLERRVAKNLINADDDRHF